MIFTTTNTGTIELPPDAPEGEIIVEIKKATEKNLRTTRVNRAMHKFFAEIASAMNEKGEPFTCAISGFKYPVPPELIKETVWRPLQVALTGKKSTTQLTNRELGKIAEMVQIAIRDATTIWVDFPSEKTLSIKHLIQTS